MSRLAIKVSNGKYTFEQPEGSPTRMNILRHGEPHLADVPGFNAIHSMMCELDAARVVLAAVREAMTMDLLQGGPTPRQVIEAALARHAGLVDDHEPPSAWALPAGVAV